MRTTCWAKVTTNHPRGTDGLEILPANLVNTAEATYYEAEAF